MTTKYSNRLIILRGPSGSGKTTVAKHLFSLAETKTVIIHQDYYRFIFKPEGGGSKTNAAVIGEMIVNNCASALAAGYDVILEGILSGAPYSEILNQIIQRHSGPSYPFYFDISFEETARRHKIREASSGFTVDDMRSIPLS